MKTVLRNQARPCSAAGLVTARNGRIRVLTISHSCLVHENQKLLEELARDKGIALTLLVPTNYRAALREHRLEKDKDPNYTILPAKTILSGNKYSNHLHFYRDKIRQALRDSPPDVVFIQQEPWSVCMQQVALLRDKRSRLVFYTAQNMIKQYPFPFNAFRLRSFRASDAAVAVSEEAKAVLEREGFKKPVYVLPHGVDTEAFRPDEAIRRAARRRFRLEGFVAGYAGRLMAEKGIFDLLEAVESLGPEYRLMVVGDGPQKDEFLGRAAKLGLTDRLTMVGTVAHDEVPGLMPAMDALVLPSRTCPSWKEQFGRVLIEAMACGVPVVGSDSGEIPGTIGQAGLIFPEGDTGALADALSRLRWSPELKESLVAKGLQKAREFGWQAAAQRLGEIFRTMMER